MIHKCTYVVIVLAVVRMRVVEGKGAVRSLKGCVTLVAKEKCNSKIHCPVDKWFCEQSPGARKRVSGATRR